MVQLANFVLMLVVWVLVVVGVFDGVRRLAEFGVTKRLVLQVCGYALAGTIFGSLHFWMHKKEIEMVEALDRNPYAQLPQDWAKDQPAQAREKGSRSYATAAFMGHGVQLNHLDGHGKWVQFQPTTKDLADREQAVAVRAQLAEQSNSFWSLTLKWWLSWPIAALVGLAAGRRARRVAANNTVEPDAKLPPN
jgi:hypothetical protein